MTRNDLKLVCFYLARIYVLAAVIYSVYLWTSVQTHHASVRTAIALLAFAVCTLLPERFSKNALSERLVMLFGVIGTTIMLIVVYEQAG